jgi:alkyldihydroxyacetonephosphate synthase
VLRLCHEARIPVTPAAGRSSVVGGTVPVHGGVLLDLTGLSGIVSVDATSGVVEVLAGTFGDAFEAELSTNHGLTVGHWPQSMALSTVGGWIACRGAGQLSNRYGKIEDIVLGLEVVLADGRTIRTGGPAPPEAVGPELTRLFVGAEGTLGVITRAWLQAWPTPTGTRPLGLGVRQRSGRPSRPCAASCDGAASPAVLRLYDGIESERNFGVDRSVQRAARLRRGRPRDGRRHHGRGHRRVRSHRGRPAGRRPGGQWFGHRNDVAALETFISKGYVVDTLEVSAPWAALDRIYERDGGRHAAVPGSMLVSAHQSHSYPTGACLYFTFGGLVAPDERDAYYTAVWDAGTRTVLTNGGSLSHHHGIGLNRARFVREALGERLRRAHRGEGRAGPQRRVQPGQARPPRRLRGSRLAEPTREPARDRPAGGGARCRLRAAARGAGRGGERAPRRPGPQAQGCAQRHPVGSARAFWLSGFVAGREATDRRAVHGALAGAAAFVPGRGHRRAGPARPRRRRLHDPDRRARRRGRGRGHRRRGPGRRRPTTPPPEPGGSP